MAVLSNFKVPVDGTQPEGTTLMPKLQYRFRVTFQNLGGSNATDSLIRLTRNLVSVGRPDLQHDDITLEVYNSRVYLAGKHTWNPIQCIIRDDVDGHVIKAIGSQVQNQMDHSAQSAPIAAVNYKFSTLIETLDGANPVADENILDAWSLSGCYLSQIQYGESNYANNDAQIVTMTIRYDNAEQTGANGLAILSRAPSRLNVGATSSN
jgi:hypothetical protein|tara:strand:- start:4071 stop:4694 length:624 start_codon:yes stop_codon:yes gene_type:complete